MPLCLIQSLPGIRYSLTDILTVVVPSQSAQLLEGVSPSFRKQTREGRAAFHTDAEPPLDGQPFSFEQLALMCKEWREHGIFSFVEVRVSGEIGDEEKSYLHRLKQCADWLILDATSEMTLPSGVLQEERWGHQALLLKQVGKKVGLRLTIDRKLPPFVLFPWIAKAALELGAPGFVFVEGESVGAVASFVRGVQDILSCHPLSKDSARLIPVLRSSVHIVEDRPFEVLEFPPLDALVIESCRPFFGGVAVRQEAAERLFGLSLWKAVVGMVSEKRSSASFLRHAAAGLSSIPEELRQPLVRGVYDLLYWASQADQTKTKLAKTSLEAVWSQICQEVIQGGDEMANIYPFTLGEGKMVEPTLERNFLSMVGG